MVSPKDIKLLIVDDDADLLETIAETFQILGFSVETAPDGEAAWAELEKKQFDLVLTDIRMPKLDGLGLIDRIRKRHASEPPIFVISGFTDTDEEELYARGMDGFFAKPFDATAIRQTLTQALVPKSERYRKPQNVFIKREVRKSFKSLEDAAKKHELNFGRLGFFLHLDLESLRVGDNINFHFDFREAGAFQFIEGVGRIVWTRKASEKAPAGIGVEIRSLSEGCLDKYIDWIKKLNPVPSIPRG